MLLSVWIPVGICLGMTAYMHTSLEPVGAFSPNFNVLFPSNINTTNTYYTRIKENIKHNIESGQWLLIELCMFIVLSDFLISHNICS